MTEWNVFLNPHISEWGLSFTRLNGEVVGLVKTRKGWAFEFGPLNVCRYSEDT